MLLLGVAVVAKGYTCIVMLSMLANELAKLLWCNTLLRLALLLLEVSKHACMLCMLGLNLSISCRATPPSVLQYTGM